MGKVNIGKVLVGGLVAGIVIDVGEAILNMVVVADATSAAFQRLGLPEPGGAAIAVYLLMGVLLGILTVWLYAAIRPRYGAGPRTALLAGAAAWALFTGLRALDFLASGILPARLIVITLLWAFLEMAVAALVGASLYSEPAA